MNQHICPNKRFHMEAILPYQSTRDLALRWLEQNAPLAVYPGCLVSGRSGRFVTTMRASQLQAGPTPVEGLKVTVRRDKGSDAVTVWFAAEVAQ